MQVVPWNASRTLECKCIIFYFIIIQILISERKKDPSLDSAEDKSVQDWDLKDVIFVEDKRNIPVGKVLKVKTYRIFL